MHRHTFLIMRREALRRLVRICEERFNEGLFTSRWFSAASIRPTESVYGGQRSTRPITQRVIRDKFLQGETLSMVTAYDYPSAVHVENSEIDFLLVGDSAAMVVHGYETTLPITLEEMILHCQSVVRGASRPFIIGDLPFGSYEISTQQAIASGTRMLKEGRVDAIKLEGGTEPRVEAVREMTKAGIAVMGHVGLTPQMISVLGGFRPQAQLAEEAILTVRQGKALAEAGCFALLLECVPAAVGAALQCALDIPVVGIGAGPACAGQVTLLPLCFIHQIDVTAGIGFSRSLGICPTPTSRQSDAEVLQTLQ